MPTPYHPESIVSEVLNRAPGWWHKIRLGLAPIIDHAAILAVRSAVYEQMKTFRLATDLQPKDRFELGIINTAWHGQMADVLVRGATEYPNVLDQKKIDRIRELRSNFDTLSVTAQALNTTAVAYLDTAYLHGQEAWEIATDLINQVKTTAASFLESGNISGPLMTIYERIIQQEKRREEMRNAIRSRVERLLEAGSAKVEELADELVSAHTKIEDQDRQITHLRQQLSELKAGQGANSGSQDKNRKTPRF